MKNNRVGDEKLLVARSEQRDEVICGGI